MSYIGNTDYPSDWRILRNKFIFTDYFGGSWGEDPLPDQTDNLVRVVRVTEFDTDRLVTNESVPTIRSLLLEPSSKKLLREGDLILEKSGGGEKTPVGRVVMVNHKPKEPMINSNFTNLCRPNTTNVDPRFLVYSLHSSYQLGITTRNIKQTTGIQNLDIDGFMGEKTLIPPLQEQQLISRYLDNKTEQIDSLIEKIQKKIELLKEQRTSLINQCVTKGLDPNVEMKDSGVEWIGEIPSHWKFLPLKRLLGIGKDSMRTGPFGSELKSSEFVDSGKYRVFNQRTVYDQDYESGDLFITEEKYQKLSGFRVCPGDLLITTRGTIGKVSEVPDGVDEGVIHPCLIRFRIDRNSVFSQFLTLYINESSHFINNVLYESDSTTIEVIYSETLKNVHIPVPYMDEQVRIVERVKSDTDKLDLLITRERTRLGLLSEYRQSLISSVVTGKVRVTEDMI